MMSEDLLTQERARSACVAVAHMMEGNPLALGHATPEKQAEHVAGLRDAARIIVEQAAEIAELRRSAGGLAIKPSRDVT